MLEGLLVGIIDASLLRKAMQSCSGVDNSDNPDDSGPHWYCDAVVCDLKTKYVFLVEISYNAHLGGWEGGLIKRLRSWNENWLGVRAALVRDCGVSAEWAVRPWLFVPEGQLSKLVAYFDRIRAERALDFCPRVTPLEMVQPWRYRSWNRKGE